MSVTQDIYSWFQYWHTKQWNTRTKHHERRPTVVWPHLLSTHASYCMRQGNPYCFPKIWNSCGARIKHDLLSSGQATSQQYYHIKLPEPHHVSENIWKKQLQKVRPWNFKVFQQLKQFRIQVAVPVFYSGRHTRLWHKRSLALDLDEQNRGDIKLHLPPPREWLPNNCCRYNPYDVVNLICAVSILHFYNVEQ